jgi:hypothetical protein
MAHHCLNASIPQHLVMPVPGFFLTDPEAEKPPFVSYSPPPFARRHGRLYRLVGYIVRRKRIFIRWDLMEIAEDSA